MIEAILPAVAAVAEARDDGARADLFPEEEAVVARAVEKRRREFATGRACAHRALERLGLERAAIPSGDRGEPLWPAGVVGTITHCRDYRACAVARASDLASVAIDAEPHATLPDGVIGEIARPEELADLARLARTGPARHWDRLLFCAKEAVYKAWYPLAERRLGFADAAVSFDPERGDFSARLLVPGPLVNGRRVEGFEGRWLVQDGLALTAIAVNR